MSIDITIEEELSAQFFDLFDAKIGMSEKTGYDWRSVSTETKSKQTTITVDGTVPAGE